MHILRRGALLLPLLTALVLSALATPALAAPVQHHLRGTVQSISGTTSLVVTTRKEGDVTVNLPAGLAPFSVGDRVRAKGRLSADGKTFDARRIQLVKRKR